MAGGHVFHRSTRSLPPLAAGGDGIFLIDAEGRRYVDACGGAAVSCLGHGHPAVLAAMAHQTAELEYAHTGFFTTNAAEKLGPGSSRRVPGRSIGSGTRAAAPRRSKPR